MKDIVCKEFISFKSIVEAYQFRKMNVDYKQNIILLVQDHQDRPCIIYLDKNNGSISNINLNVDIDVESVICMQRIGERWLFIFNYEDKNAVIYNPDGSEYVEFYAGEEITIELFNSEEIEEGQVGYSITDNGESLMSNEEGSWQESWIVIGLDSYIGDPIFVDTKDIGCAVYTAEHGEGMWTPVLVAESIEKVIQVVKEKNC